MICLADFQFLNAVLCTLWENGEHLCCLGKEYKRHKLFNAFYVTNQFKVACSCEEEGKTIMFVKSKKNLKSLHPSLI